MDILQWVEDIRVKADERGKDPVADGSFDRFIECLSKQMAADRWQYDESVFSTIHAYDNLRPADFVLICEAWGIPDIVIAENDVTGRDYFLTQYKAEVYLMSEG
jgi:hypothetical protein